MKTGLGLLFQPGRLIVKAGGFWFVTVKNFSSTEINVFRTLKVPPI